MREELEKVVLKMKEMNLSLEELLDHNKQLGFSEDVVTVIDSAARKAIDVKISKYWTGDF
ncbi:hypothetical protein ROU88_09035 [Macrococcus capreoli]|uniref:hypothetical protein n=1 Tax=Macrococcus capreoli TaxID=2982690 RepID=UPI0021D5AD49|nr:hypothetical protein [Macrococcus sp. TMW 2.2395]MCU7557850.1 hypothetical protein [Macrococcus sp. TMW 2.2395]